VARSSKDRQGSAFDENDILLITAAFLGLSTAAQAQSDFTTGTRADRGHGAYWRGARMESTDMVCMHMLRAVMLTFMEIIRAKAP